MLTVSAESESRVAATCATVSDPPHVPARGVAGWLRDLAVVATLAAVTAVPWLDQRFVPLTWLVLAAPLAAVGLLRGWRGETLVLAWFATTLGIAFHWAPAVITKSLDTSPAFGLGMAVVMVLWDAARWSAPFWFIGRTVRNPLVAWLPAGLVAVVTEWLAPGIFPWKIGYTQIAWPVTVQAADLFGPEFTTFVAFAHAGAVVWLWHAAAALVRPAAGSAAGISPWSAVAFAPLVVCVANLGYGLWAIDHWTAAAAAAPRLRAAVVQVNSALDEATPLLQEQTRAICAAAGADDPFDIVIWPECSGGSYDAALECLADEKRVWALSREPERGLRPLASPACPLLFGGKIFTGEPEKPRTLHQSAILIDCAERIVGRYHKRHLMPFGEYVPGSSWLRDIKFWFPLDDEFHEGSEATVLRVPGQAALGVMLCYEDMVPSAARSLVRGGADVLVSLINGAAFTNPLTLCQHRLLAQLRAVECRRSFIRCAATGETCLIDPVGRITERLPLHVQDTLVVEAPRLESLTVYARTGPVFPPAAAAILGIGLGWPWLRRRHDAGRSATIGMLLAAVSLLTAAATGCSRTAEQSAVSDAQTAAGPSGAATAPGSTATGTGSAPAGSAAAPGGSAPPRRPSGWFGGGSASPGEAVNRLAVVLREASSAIDDGDYAVIGKKVAAVRSTIAQVDRAFAAGGLDAAQAAEAKRAVAGLTTACNTVERVLRSGEEVNDIQLAAFRGRVKTSLEALERLAK